MNPDPDSPTASGGPAVLPPDLNSNLFQEP